MDNIAQTEKIAESRHEVVSVNGLVVTGIMAIIGSLFVVGIGLWLHNISLLVAEKQHGEEMSKLYSEMRKKKNMIVEKEGVANWNETSYAATHAGVSPQ
jgi:hypothetical protein